MEFLKNSLNRSHELIMELVKDGDTVVDATAGNGHDTLLLASLVGPSGKVYSFDIQEKAVGNTRKRLDDAGLLDRVNLAHDSHENLDKYISSKIKAVMFNLGYLPGGDHSIGTRAASTIKALDKALELLEPNGLAIVVLYYGGDSGFEEKDALMYYIKGIDHRRYTVQKTEFANLPNCPPILICIEKRPDTTTIDKSY